MEYSVGEGLSIGRQGSRVGEETREKENHDNIGRPEERTHPLEDINKLLHSIFVLQGRGERIDERQDVLGHAAPLVVSVNSLR